MEYFTSDQHFGHLNIIKYAERPFESVEEMAEVMVERWNAVVKSDDIVYSLGDLAMGRSVDSLAYVKRLNGFKVFVPGNHDKCWNGHKKWQPFMNEYSQAGLHIVQGPVPHILNGRPVTLSHFPQQCDFRKQSRHEEGKDFSYEPDRFADHRPKRGPVLHGHVHQMWKKRGTDVNVGVDVWDFTPVSADELHALLDSNYND